MSWPIDHLVELLGRGFHEGWSDEHASAEACLERLLDDATTERKQAAAAEIDALLGGGLCENQVRDVLLYEIGCWYAPEIDGLEASSWLTHVASRLRDP